QHRNCEEQVDGRGGPAALDEGAGDERRHDGPDAAHADAQPRGGGPHLGRVAAMALGDRGVERPYTKAAPPLAMSVWPVTNAQSCDVANRTAPVISAGTATRWM